MALIKYIYVYIGPFHSSPGSTRGKIHQTIQPACPCPPSAPPTFEPPLPLPASTPSHPPSRARAPLVPERHPPLRPAPPAPVPSPACACPVLVVAWCWLAVQGRCSKREEWAVLLQQEESNRIHRRHAFIPRRHPRSAFLGTHHLVGSFLYVRTCSASCSLLC
jgi:hypothetical protein